MTTPIVRYIDHDGVETECRCFSEYHAMQLEDGLDAEGLDHFRVRPRSRHDAPMDRFPGRSVRLESRGFPGVEG